MNPISSQATTKRSRDAHDDAALTSIQTELDEYLKILSNPADDEAINRIITLFQKKILSNEKNIWLNPPTKQSITVYQNSFKALEQLHKLKSHDDRYNFRIVIPVADRPQHLKQCLDSLLTLCQGYTYGGIKNNRFKKISVLIADDSKEENNINQHIACCAEFSKKGLDIDYFGLEQQLELVNNVSAFHDGLKPIISDSQFINNIIDFSHKGASVMRNITYLKLHQDIPDKNTLIYFIDSDQEFCITTDSDSDSDNKYYAINYFHYLNEIFNNPDISILTGKVVGDPPVSPSVMARNFQQDIENFLHHMAALKPTNKCQFHHHHTANKSDAAYHDMADLFGFSSNSQTFDYQCTLHGEHNNADCFNDFSRKLGHFFYGEHPTRKTYFSYEDGFSKTSPARTVYTGNYVIKAEALDYFIPFASLKLRMAGPVLGRILKTTLKDKFVSANLPMLHNRTIESTGKSEFRAGVTHNNENVDLGSEFIRQFYGDIMLFSIEKITNSGYPSTAISRQTLKAVLHQTYCDIKESYIEKHHAILQLKNNIEEQLNDHHQWWNNSAKTTPDNNAAVSNFNSFLNNIQSNFADNADAFQKITVADQVEKHLNNILLAILNYPDNLDSWSKIFKQ